MARYELRRGSRVLRLSRIPMEFLILLVEQRGKLVERETIAAHLWPSDKVSVDVTQGINSAVKRIRAALNDDAAKPRFIETVVGKGYRFIADVECVEVEPPVPVLPVEQKEFTSPDSATRKNRVPRNHQLSLRRNPTEGGGGYSPQHCC